ncbi:MAG: sigma-70 family RNA polymerase sigma factor, partial [Bacteroidota bacterium]
QAYQQMGDKCRELLKLFYYRGFSIKEIVVETGYKDENTVKSYKSRCLKKLKETIRMYHG